MKGLYKVSVVTVFHQCQGVLVKGDRVNHTGVSANDNAWMHGVDGGVRYNNVGCRWGRKQRVMMGPFGDLEWEAIGL